MQFASGAPPDLVQKRDLIPEITYEEAHSLIAADFMTFVNVRLSNGADAAAVSALNHRLSETETFITPILDSLKMEGYHNFRPPCLCTDDVCEEMPNCTAASSLHTVRTAPSMSTPAAARPRGGGTASCSRVIRSASRWFRVCWAVAAQRATR